MKGPCINCFNVGVGVVYTCGCSLHIAVVDEYHHCTCVPLVQQAGTGYKS